MAIRWLRAIGAAGLILAVAVVASEMILRAVAPLHLSGIARSYRYDEDLGYRLKDGVHEFELKDFLEEIRTNSLGTVNYQESFGSYTQRIFALGDSYTQGTGIAPDAAYPFQLDLELNTDEAGFYRPHYAVVNLGLAAFGGEQSLLALHRYAERLGEPHIVLYLGSDNDHDDDVLFRSGYRHRHIVEGSPSWGPLVGPLQWMGRFEVYKRSKIAASALRRMRLVAPETVGGGSDPERSPSVAEQCWPVLQKIRIASESHGAPLVLGWANAKSPSYAWLRDQARKEGVRFADWLPRVQAVRALMPAAPTSNPHSGGHLRTWVNRVIARTYADEVRAIASDRGSPPAAPQPTTRR